MSRNRLFTSIVSSRLVKAYEELSEFIKSEDDLKESKEYALALTLLVDAKLQMP